MNAPTLKRLQVFVPFACGYFLSYLFRVVNSVIAPELIADLGLGPSALGLLTATYLIAFASSQLPLGMLLDRFGPRKVEAVLLLFAAAGALVFARAESIFGLAAGRALIGFGVSACLMAAFKAFTLWFPSRQWPRINGFQLAAGGLGALSATTPVHAALQVTDWRGVFLMLAAVTAAVAVAVWAIVPERKAPPVSGPRGGQLRGVVAVFSSPLFWRIAPLATASQATFMALQGLWAGPWLGDVAGMDRGATAGILLWVAAAMATGYISIGYLTEWLTRRGVPPMVTAVWGMGAFMLVQGLLIAGPVAWAVPLWVLFGFLGTSGVVPYPALTQSFPAELAGRVNTSLNLLVFVAAFAAQWGVGAVIALWPVSPGGAYHPHGYTTGFALMLALQVLCLAWYAAAGLTRRRPGAGPA
jgi:predicted MFS family arabinose efflux permease